MHVFYSKIIERNQDILKLLLENCKNLQTLDISNCKNVDMTQLQNIFQSLDWEDGSSCLGYIDITGIGESSFEDYEKFNDYWFQDSKLIMDLEGLAKLIPNTLIMPSVCPKCARNTCYPPDIDLKCLFCKDNVYWVCDDCELVSYRICYQCVQEDSENGIDTVTCFNCLNDTRQKVCHKCDDWKCPSHVSLNCGCSADSI